MSGGLALSHAEPVGGAMPFAMIDEARGVYATSEQMIGWVGMARRGDEFAYATRCITLLPGGRKVAATVADLYQRGFVVPLQRRISGGFDRNYIVQRTGKPWQAGETGAAGEIRGKRPGVVIMDAMGDGLNEVDAQNALLPVLERFARFGRPCPTDAQLAVRAGITKDQVKAVLAALCGAGAISIAPARAPTLRQITIMATGQKTGMVK